MNKVAIIPARGGSKRIPRKNIKTFAGQPIIAYSINAAITSNLFDRIILSTDSEQIAEVGSSYGAEVPFMRPAELSDDFTGTAEVLIHSLNWLTENDKFYPYFCCIYPTAPFLEKEYLVKGFNILRKNNATSAFSVTSFPYPIFRALKIEANNRIKMFWPEHLHSRSNDLPDAYHDAGQFYWCDTKKFLKEKIVFSSDSVPVVLPRNLVQDIDTHEDWETAEKLYRAFKSHKPVNKDQNV
jgi:pseudaminic acid cytidylyltransferase